MCLLSVWYTQNESVGPPKGSIEITVTFIFACITTHTAQKFSGTSKNLPTFRRYFWESLKRKIGLSRKNKNWVSANHLFFAIPEDQLYALASYVATLSPQEFHSPLFMNASYFLQTAVTCWSSHRSDTLRNHLTRSRSFPVFSNCSSFKCSSPIIHCSR